jgi:hypothetical protein
VIAMSLPFDAVLKDMGREDPRAFLAEFDQPTPAPVSLLNVDLSTVTTAADLVIGVGDPLQEIIHLDFQSSAAAWKHADTLVYNALLYRNSHVPVHSSIILLRPQAAHPNLNGVVSYSPRPGRGSMDFEYEPVRLWERPAEELLAGGLGILPLAMLGRLPEGVTLQEALTGIAQRLIERLNREAPPDQIRRLLTSAWVLTGLRVQRDIAREVFRGVQAMRDSDTYMAIIDEGRETEVKRLILRVGQKRFGAADDPVITRINAISDLDRLERMHDRAFEASNWEEIIDTP